MGRRSDTKKGVSSGILVLPKLVVATYREEITLVFGQREQIRTGREGFVFTIAPTSPSTGRTRMLQRLEQRPRVGL